MKKLILLVLALGLAVLSGAGCAENGKHDLTSASFPLYYETFETGTDMRLYFVDGVKDLPYIEAEDMLAMLEEFYDAPAVGIDIHFTLEKNGSVLTYRRLDDQYHLLMTLDFERDTIDFVDYNMFCQRGDASTIMDSVVLNVFNSKGEPTVFQKVDKGSYTRFGDPLTFYLEQYGIDLIAQDGLYLIPLQTMSDIIMSPSNKGNFFFNGKNLILSSDLKSCAQVYYDVPTGKRSQELADFGYGELCMLLDYFYGLRDTHKIDSFTRLFHNVGFDVILKDPDAEQADLALYRTIVDFLDDNHTSWNAFSYLSGPVDYKASGAARTHIFDHLERQEQARAKAYPQGIPGYEEVGNTAYITFDHFDWMVSDAEEYYGVEDPRVFPDEDTIGLIMKAHAMITRENSPVENVVLDLSANLGGADDAAIFAMAWFLGEASISVTDNMTGAMCTTVYRADVNRDRKFDEQDTVSDKHLFCLISPVSFSCGNLVPCIFKESGKVTLLGRTSGGGSCAVMNTSTAWGTAFQISSNQRMSFLKNGSFYDIDRGADPDFVLASPERYYDRAALTEYLNSIR